MAWFQTDLRLPDLGRTEKIMYSSCHLHLLRAKDGYATFHNEYACSCMEGKIASHQTMGNLQYQGFVIDSAKIRVSRPFSHSQKKKVAQQTHLSMTRCTAINNGYPRAFAFLSPHSLWLLPELFSCNRIDRICHQRSFSQRRQERLMLSHYQKALACHLRLHRRTLCLYL